MAESSSPLLVQFYIVVSIPVAAFALVVLARWLSFAVLRYRSATEARRLEEMEADDAAADSASGGRDREMRPMDPGSDAVSVDESAGFQRVPTLSGSAPRRYPTMVELDSEISVLAQLRLRARAARRKLLFVFWYHM